MGGGPRRLDPSRDVAILQAALEGLAEHGYDRLSMDDIAARARVGKAAIYRRWASKAALVVDTVVWWREQVHTATVPDTGSLRGDIEALIAALPDLDEADRSTMSVLLGVGAAAIRDPALAAALDDHALDQARQVLGVVFDNATGRGEIPPGRDLTLVPDIFVGLNMLRLVTGRPVDQAFVRRVFEDVVLPLATATVSDRPPARRGRPAKR